MKSKEVTLVHERIRERIVQRRERGAAGSPEGEMLFDELCDLFDAVLTITERCKEKEQ